MAGRGLNAPALTPNVRLDVQKVVEVNGYNAYETALYQRRAPQAGAVSPLDGQPVGLRHGSTPADSRIG
jgi:hypothetical protein